MRYINNRNKEPEELKKYREETPGVKYDDLGKDRKDIIRNSLLDEQGYICAYCMGRIDINNCTIEHYISQTRHEDSPYTEEEHKRQSLLYSNMSGVCVNDSTHCDKKRGNTPLLVLDPHDPTCENYITYKLDGTVVPSGLNVDQVNQDITTLGLNCDKLIKFRNATWDEVWERFKINHKKENWTKSMLLDKADYYRSKKKGRKNLYKFHAYCNYIAWCFEQYANKY